MLKAKIAINFWLAFVLFILMLAAYYSIKTYLVSEENSNKPVLPVIEKSLSAPDTYGEIQNAQLDIRYATTNNFTSKKIYPCGRCFLRKEVKSALAKAQKSFKNEGFKIVLFDCYRPAPAQQKLWEIVPNPDYLTPPEKGSMHNRGLAVDISLTDLNGKPLNMGTTYDYFGKEAHIDFTGHPQAVLDNRKLLSKTMEKVGFKGIRTEWWHFSFENLSSPVNDWQWACE